MPRRWRTLREGTNTCLIIVGVGFFPHLHPLWYLQTIRGSEFRRSLKTTASESERIPRTVDSWWIEKAVFWPKTVPASKSISFQKTSRRIRKWSGKWRQMLNLAQDEIEEKIKSQKRRAPFKPVRIKPDIEWNELALLESNRVYLPGCWSMSDPRGPITMGTWPPI